MSPRSGSKLIVVPFHLAASQITLQARGECFIRKCPPVNSREAESRMFGATVLADVSEAL